MGHGVSVSEVPTGVVPASRTTAGLPVYVGTAPINLGDPSFVNKPGVFYTLAEFVAACGPLQPSSMWELYTLHEAAFAHFSVYSVAPIVCINVLSPEDTDHTNAVVGAAHILGADNTVQLQVYGAPDEATFGIIKSTVVVKVGATTKTLGTDYTLAFDDDGFLVVTRVTSGTILAGATILVNFTYFDPAGVTSADIIGGYSGGLYTGLEVIEQVYPRLRLVPGFLVAPKWSEEPTVAARMGVIARSINGSFRATALVDLSSDVAEIASYAAAGAWKSDNGYDSIDMISSWGLPYHGTDVFHGSTVIACVANQTDVEHDGIPYASPSNKDVIAERMLLGDDSEVLLTRPQANSLNDQGIVTFLNGFNGWKVWGNRTGGYPGTTDPKDTFIPVRRMFNWIGNTIILTTDNMVDEPGNRRLIDSVLGTIQSFLNGLIATGALVAGKIEFRADENPLVDLADGTIRWHLTLTPPSPGQELEFVLEYDPNALAALFE